MFSLFEAPLPVGQKRFRAALQRLTAEVSKRSLRMGQGLDAIECKQPIYEEEDDIYQ